MPKPASELGINSYMGGTRRTLSQMSLPFRSPHPRLIYLKQVWG